MLLIATFWLCLWLPGYASLRRFAPGALSGGGLSHVALGYLASFALLSPISVAGFLLHLPLWVLSGSIVIAVALGAWSLLRQLWREFRWRRPTLAAVIPAFAALVIATDMLLGLRAGAFFSGDAQYHMARVRMLLSYGFNSWDPLVSGHKLDLVYHSNLYHALMASAAQLSGQEAPVAWAYGWFWAKLFCAAATYQLAFSVLGERTLAWIAAVTFALWMAPSSTLLYPNTVSSLGMLAILVSFAVELLAAERPARLAVLGLGASALVIVQFHALYYLFAVLIVGPLVLIRLLRIARWRLPGGRELAIVCLVLAIGTPWFAVRALARWQPGARSAVPATQAAPATAKPAAESVLPPEPPWATKGFIRLERGFLVLDPSALIDPRAPTFQVLLALLAGLFTRRRPQFLAIGAALGIVLLVVYVPLLCTLADRVVGGAWVVRRLSTILTSAHLALFPTTFALLANERLRASARALHPALGFATLAAALALAYTFGVNARPFDRPRYIGSGLRGGRVHSRLVRYAELRRLFNANIDRDAVVAVQLNRVYDLVIACDCYPLALPPNRGTRGVRDMPARQAAVGLMLNQNAAFASRVAALREYGVRDLVLKRAGTARALGRAYRPFRTQVAGAASFYVVSVDWDHIVKRRH